MIPQNMIAGMGFGMYKIMQDYAISTSMGPYPFSYGIKYGPLSISNGFIASPNQGPILGLGDLRIYCGCWAVAAIQTTGHHFDRPSKHRTRANKLELSLRVLLHSSPLGLPFTETSQHV